MRANVTRAAEGFDRRSFTVAEILRMQDAGIIAEDENFELIEGEIVPMQAKTHVHELLEVGAQHRSRAGAARDLMDGRRDRRSISAPTPSSSRISSSIPRASSSKR